MSGKPKFFIPKEVDKKFREEVFRRYGMKKGNITRALIEAIELWIRTGRVSSSGRRGGEGGTR